ncbi:MAG: ABC transporter substrate-binding protein, partial [Chloroflexota bacterium]
MCKQTFGKICQSLRQDLFDLSKGKPYSQSDLAEATNIPFKVIGQIERGEKVNIDRDILSRLATAFNLTTVERDRFYLLVNHDIDLKHEAQSHVFREIQAYMRSLKTPVLLHDGLHRILTISQACFEIYGLTWEYLNDIPADDPTKYHTVRHMHDPISPVRVTYTTQLDAISWNSVSYWRFLSLAYRHTAQFQQIQATLLSRYAHFAYLWNGLNSPFPKNDMTGLIRAVSCIHPKFGRLEYSVISNQINDHGRELFLSTLIPYSQQTLDLFNDLMRYEGTTLIDFSSKPAPQLVAKHDPVRLDLLVGEADLKTGPADKDGSTRLFTDDCGRTIEIPANPQKILFADSEHAAKVTTLGYVPYATRDSYGSDFVTILEGIGGDVGDLSSVINVGKAANWPNLEKILEIQPDLIVWWDWDSKIIEQLQEIAPTIGLNPRVNGPGGYHGPGGPRYSKQRTYASLVGLEYKLDEQITAYEAQLADVKGRHAEFIEDLKWNFFDTSDYSLPHMYDLEAFDCWAYVAVMRDLGMTPAAAMREATAIGLGYDKNFGYAQVSPESVGDYTADLLF